MKKIIFIALLFIFLIPTTPDAALFGISREEFETKMQGLINQNLDLKQQADELNMALANIKLEVGNIRTEVDLKISGLDKSNNVNTGDVEGDVKTTNNDTILFFLPWALVLIFMVDDMKDKVRLSKQNKTIKKYETELDTLREEGKIT